MAKRVLTAVTAALILTALATGLGGCGKKGPPHAPAGEESAYTHPRFYPPRDPKAPKTDVPAAEDEGPLEEELTDEPVPLPPLSRSRRSTTTYGPAPP